MMLLLWLVGVCDILVMVMLKVKFKLVVKVCCFSEWVSCFSECIVFVLVSIKVGELGLVEFGVVVMLIVVCYEGMLY